MFEVWVNGKKWFTYRTREEAQAKVDLLSRHMNARITIEHIVIGASHV